MTKLAPFDELALAKAKAKRIRKNFKRLLIRDGISKVKLIG